jgi:hypothetical protein
MEWQPIESAPKDGTEFLIYRPRRSYESPKIKLKGSIYPSIHETEVKEKYAIGKIRKDGTLLIVDVSSSKTGYAACFTHWMPLPKPPTKTGE